MATHDYDDDIFTLAEDEASRRRAHILQYTLVSLFAVVVIAAGLYLSFWLTNERMTYQSKIQTDEQQTETLQQTQNADDWPEAQYPNIPKLKSSAYDTRLIGERAEINVPMSAAAGFDQYAASLADDGAQVYVESRNLTVLGYKDVEIHLISGSGKNAVVLCGETKIQWNEAGYQSFPTPDTGTLVDVSEGTGENSRVLTYRMASATDAIAYCRKLAAEGWIIVGTLEPEDQIFACSFKKDNMQVSVDYFSGGDNYRVRFDFLNNNPSDT